MIDIEGISEEITDFIHRKPILTAITAVILFFFVLALVVVMIQTRPAKKVKYEKSDFTPDSELIIPDKPTVEKDYYPSREIGKEWTEDEIEEYLTIPDGQILNELEKANDKIAADITGAAP